MDFFEQRYYVLNKRFMSYFGMWPLENSIRSKLLFYFVIFTFFTMYVPEMIKIIELGTTDKDTFIECIPPIIVLNTSMVKAFNVSYHLNHFKMLLKHIEKDWKRLTDVKEMAILSTYAESGRKLTIWYTLIAVLIATDTLYFVYSEHACGIFAILSYRLNNVGKCNNVDERYDNDLFNKNKYYDYDEIEDERNYQELSFCIKSHKYAIEYVELLQTCYTESLIVMLLLNVIGISITGVQTIINIHNLSNLCRFGFLTLGEAFHLFFLTLPSQRIIDHSAKVFKDCYDSYWYVLSTRCKKTLGLILLRSMTPCQLMAGGLYSMTLENFVSLVQTAMSYFTVLSSVR
ncbi:hypothetical protein M0802_011978 [Mischocyttarus mexicanus]|nr:hypothetical protein M0802_011978 [Mischocyttarus mexicanus]